jgi:heme A synthase
MSIEIIISIAAVIILWLLFTWSIKVFQATIKTLLVILAIFFLVQIVFGIDSQQIIQEVIRIVNYLERLILGK